ncbi:MAG: HNH endonuclease [Gammaproteobacteria bacterium]|nr:HNH endonuclease [Gammaproteobacteria bacterium]MBU1968054.1 HNH endonuclease [Gammaproteobacteria bacterium]
MGDGKRRRSGIGSCIYCGATSSLSREHVLPYGLGGDLVLNAASCESCAKETGRVELRLLRGHWWPYRLCLGLPSRRAGEQVPDLPVKVKRPDGTEYPAHIPMERQTIAMAFVFDPPSILTGVVKTEPPSGRVNVRALGTSPSYVIVDGIEKLVPAEEKIEIPVNLDAAGMCRFLAKVAQGYAISRRGLSACREYFLPEIVLGRTDGAQTYVGGANSQILGERLPGNGLHALMDRVNGEFLTVYIQLFRARGGNEPIYEVVVGRL